MTDKHAVERLLDPWQLTRVSARTLSKASQRGARYQWSTGRFASWRNQLFGGMVEVCVGVVGGSFLHHRSPEKKRIGCAITNKKSSTRHLCEQ